MKAHRFVSVGDGSSLAPLQALVETDQAQGCALLPLAPDMRVSAVPIC